MTSIGTTRVKLYNKTLKSSKHYSASASASRTNINVCQRNFQERWKYYFWSKYSFDQWLSYLEINYFIFMLQLAMCKLSSAASSFHDLIAINHSILLTLIASPTLKSQPYQRNERLLFNNTASRSSRVLTNINTVQINGLGLCLCQLVQVFVRFMQVVCILE